ncbi:MAG: futalosine hydrolase [Chitinophagaceae bacterium]|nr:futalosine hydrolase [Chitinophagaceae bacterium]
MSPMFDLCTMRVLLASATSMEQAPEMVYPGIDLHRLVHGCGLLSAGVNISCAIQKHDFDLIIQLGIAGTYNPALALGDVVFVKQEQLGDCGAELADGSHANLFDLNLEHANAFPFNQQQLINPHSKFFPLHLTAVRGLTVNQSTGTNSTALQRQQQFHADIETMEGAALHYTALLHRVPFIQLRSISNRVETRNKAAWKIKESLAALHHELHLYLTALSQA